MLNSAEHEKSFITSGPNLMINLAFWLALYDNYVNIKYRIELFENKLKVSENRTFSLYEFKVSYHS